MTEALDQDKERLARDTAFIAIDALLDVLWEVGEFAEEVAKNLTDIKEALRGSPESDDRQEGGTTGPVENAGE
jgi:hypothetical protein